MLQVQDVETERYAVAWVSMQRDRIRLHLFPAQVVGSDRSRATDARASWCSIEPVRLACGPAACGWAGGRAYAAHDVFAVGTIRWFVYQSDTRTRGVVLLVSTNRTGDGV